MGHHLKALLAGILVAVCIGGALPRVATAASANDINRQVDAALNALYASNPAAVELSRRARALLVFPTIAKAGFIFGGEFGVGALRENGLTAGYYSVAAASYGLQFGAQTFGYVLFLMDDNSLSFLNAQGGWQLGVGPSIVIVDQGMARSLTTATELQGVYAVIFDQQGMMAGMGLQGSKITPYTPDF
jgi:lipid-binding SYLF domain-containing protein